MSSPREFDPAFRADLNALLETRNEPLLRTLLAQLHPADLADVLEHIDADDRTYVFGLMAEDDRPQALAEMEDGARETLLPTLSTTELAPLVEELSSDDAADLVQDLPQRIAEEVLAEISPSESEKVRRLLDFDEDTAGGIMAAEFVAVPEEAPISEAIDRIRRAGEELEDIPQVFVVDAQQRLRGMLSLRSILLSDPKRPVHELVDTDVRSVPTDLDQEEVAELVRKYDLAVVPVVDDTQRLVGQITVDDILDVYDEEAGEDIARLSGGLQEESPADSVLSVSLNRLPWLALGLGGGILAAWVISRYTGSLEAALQISFFIPVIAAMAGNVGIQASATMVRGLATGEIYRANSAARLVKEIGVGLLNALVLSGVLLLIVTLWLGTINLGIVVGISIAVAMVCAAIIGSAVPLMLGRFGIDPALATGPFVTTTSDILGLTIYLALTTLLLSRI